MRNLLLILVFLPFNAVIAAGESDIWNPVAKKICDQINLAQQYYKKGDLKNAHLTAVMSYFKFYDAELEPAVRVTLGGPHVFAIEGQFRQYAKAMTPKPDKQQLQHISTLATQLCSDIAKEAKALNEAKVPKNVFGEDNHA